MSWLSAPSLEAAEAKLANMVDLIGFPKFVLNETWVDSLYAGVEIDEDDYLVPIVH